MSAPVKLAGEPTIRRLKRETLARLRRAARVTAAKLFSVVVDISIVTIPLALKPGWKESWAPLPGPFKINWLCLWATLMVGRWLATQVRRGKHTADWNLYWSSRADVLAGNINTARRLLWTKAKGQPQDSSLVIIMGLLQQIVDVARHLTAAPEGTRIEACMLRPVVHDGKPALVAEVYNSAAAAHRHLPIPLERPGAATVAYREGREVVVVPDTTIEPYLSEFNGRRYKSIVAFLIDTGDGTGRDRVVVTIDASAPYVFTDALVQRVGIKDAISPFLAVIGLVAMQTERITGGEGQWRRQG
jgi:hypothetical protein